MVLKKISGLVTLVNRSFAVFYHRRKKEVKIFCLFYWGNRSKLKGVFFHWHPKIAQRRAWNREYRVNPPPLVLELERSSQVFPCVWRKWRDLLRLERVFFRPCISCMPKKIERVAKLLTLSCFSFRSKRR